MHLSLLALLVASLTSVAAAQVTLLKDIRPGRLGSSGTEIVSDGNFAVFAANDGGTLGNTVWATNGSPAGTYYLRTGLKNPKWFASTGDKMFFSASDAQNGQELWVTDGTPSGTVIPKKLMNGLLDSTVAVVTTHEGSVYFFAYGLVNNQRTLGLWCSDGSASGTILLKTGTLGFSTSTIATYWRSASLGKDLYFLNRETGTGELWKTDGTVAGTQMVFTFNDRAKQISPLIGWKGKVWCDVIQNAKHELWTSDGTSAGTSFLVNGWAANSMTPADSGDVMYFGFAPSGTGTYTELWKTDGTLAGTQSITNQVTMLDAPPGHTQGVPLGGRKVFFAGRVGNAMWPFVTDGTATGTVQLSSTINMWVSPQFGYHIARVGDGSVAVFHSASNMGQELGLTDGTPQGTKVFDFRPGLSITGMPTWGFVRTRENYVLYFDDGVIGNEPYAIALTWFGAAFNEQYGTGCSGTNGVPVLRGVGGAPTLGNNNFALELSNARPNAIAVLALSPQPAALTIGPCTILVDIATSILEGRTTDAAGVLRVPVVVPNNASLIGINVYWQEIVIDPQGSLVSQFALSNGLRTLVGR
ncbi:MAG: hypothetical protein H6832_17365 [Planctomycetes bacterium]|nr:hypothetical protein [Planctomycetota bacterium]MCB9920174.1 hypothetical protein [Planctomycetota bacterium]